MPGRRVAIVGTGWVGSSVAISTLHAGAADELWLCDARAAIAEGEAMDLGHGASFYPRAAVRTCEPGEIRDADVVVVAAGRNGTPGQSRLELLRENARIVDGFGRLLAGSAAIVVMVTNPVDVLTLVMQRASGLAPERVLGTGTMLDTARLRQAVGRELAIDPRSVHAQVLGEHGDSEVAVWSTAMAGGLHLRAWPGWRPGLEDALALEVRRAAYEIIARKGATNHAIGLVTATLLQSLLRDGRRVLTVSRVHDGVPGFEGVALSLPAVVGRDGAPRVLLPELDEAERAALARSAAVLRDAAATLAAG
mgnify:CR=1 FL=1